MGKNRILLVDDMPANLMLLSDLLQDEYNISVATNGTEALALAAAENRPDLILLDVMMPEMDGYEVCKRLKCSKRTKNIPVLFVTAMNEVEDETHGLELGAVDYISKPICPSIVKQRVRNHMSLHLHQEHLDTLVEERTRQLKDGYIDTIYRLTLASEFKDKETGDHIKRISHYTRMLADHTGMGKDFCEKIYHASPMHDIGKVAIPDSILLKPAALSADEWEVMKTHTEIGAKMLSDSLSPFLQMGVDIAHYHHERWDGSGYPKGLRGEEIPLTARIMNIVDQYDALRSSRPYKEGFSHERALKIMLGGDGRTLPQHFDPTLINVFIRIADRFAEIFDRDAVS